MQSRLNADKADKRAFVHRHIFASNLRKTEHKHIGMVHCQYHKQFLGDVPDLNIESLVDRKLNHAATHGEDREL